jgi:asparagine synthase (glutamine-hydrolysing)
MARRHVTVALTGDGGDEAFFGYERYLAVRAAAGFDRLPAALRRLVRPGLVPPGPPKSRRNRARRLAEALGHEPRRRYALWMTSFGDGAKDELYTPEFRRRVEPRSTMAVLDALYDRSDASSFLEASVHTDVAMYLPDDLLVKMDIASMAHSLEARSPFLDHELVEFAARLPVGLKMRRLTQKYLLKQAVGPLLPAAVRRRRKMGFAVPIDAWLRGSLRDLAYDVLLDDRALARGYFRPAVVRRYVDDHMSGAAHHHFRIWALLMFELWHRMWIDQRPVTLPATGIAAASGTLATVGER